MLKVLNLGNNILSKKKTTIKVLHCETENIKINNLYIQTIYLSHI